MNNKRSRSCALWALLVLGFILAGINVQCYRVRGTMYTPVFLSVEDVANKYRCEFDRWPASSDEIWQYMPDLYKVVEESRASAKFTFEVNQEDSDTLAITYTGRSEYFGLPYRITRRLRFTDATCKNLGSVWDNLTLEEARTRNEQDQRQSANGGAQ